MGSRFQGPVLTDTRCHSPSLLPSLSLDITTTDFTALFSFWQNRPLQPLGDVCRNSLPSCPSERVQPRLIPAHKTSLAGLTPSSLFSLAMRLMGGVRV